MNLLNSTCLHCHPKKAHNLLNYTEKKRCCDYCCSNQIELFSIDKLFFSSSPLSSFLISLHHTSSCPGLVRPDSSFPVRFRSHAHLSSVRLLWHSAAQCNLLPSIAFVDVTVWVLTPLLHYKVLKEKKIHMFLLCYLYRTYPSIEFTEFVE